MKVALIQHDIVWEDAPSNRERVAPLIARAAADGAELIVLPEMFATGFTMRPEIAAEPEGGDSESFLSAAAAEHGTFIIASLAQHEPNGAHRNNGIVAAPDREVRRYAKIHPFSFAGELEHYTAGDAHLTVNLDGLRVSVFVCYDLRFADEFWGLAADTDLYVVVANWPSARHDHWRALLRARAIENQAWVVGVNRVGSAPDVAHSGGSMVVDPLGTVITEGDDAERILYAEVDADTVHRVREQFPFLQDRR